MAATIHERPFKNKPAVRRRLVVPALALTAALALGLGFAQQVIGSSLSASLAARSSPSWLPDSWSSLLTRATAGHINKPRPGSVTVSGYSAQVSGTAKPVTVRVNMRELLHTIHRVIFALPVH